MKRSKQYEQWVRFPSPKRLVLSAVRVKGAGKLEASLDCGHKLTGKTAYPGQIRWCPTCHPPRQALA